MTKKNNKTTLLANMAKKEKLVIRYAKLDNPYFYYLLGKWYLKGCYVKQNRKKARSFFRKAAKEEVVEAMYALGLSYQKAAKGPQDLRQAYLHFLAAAIRGYPPAKKALNELHAQGVGVDAQHKEIIALWEEYAQNKLIPMAI